METYITRLDDLGRHSNGNKVLLECVKTCGYGFFVEVYPRSELADVTNAICDCLDLARPAVAGAAAPAPLKLTLRADAKPDVELNCASRETVRDLRARMPEYMVPVYPLPARIVYRVYVDDGHTHG
jgi:hypothetical protein